VNNTTIIEKLLRDLGKCCVLFHTIVPSMFVMQALSYTRRSAEFLDSSEWTCFDPCSDFRKAFDSVFQRRQFRYIFVRDADMDAAQPGAKVNEGKISPCQRITNKISIAVLVLLKQLLQQAKQSW